MPKKNLIAIIAMVVSLIAASLTLVFTVGLRVSADSAEPEWVPVSCLDIDGGVLEGFNDTGLTNYKKVSGKKYRIEVPNTVTSIGAHAFRYCSSLTSITIPSSVTSIGVCAFMDCRDLTSVTFGAGSQLTSIGESAFASCYGLTSITIPSSVTSIGAQAFDYCTGLTNITIPSSVTSIGDGVFFGWSGLTSIQVDPANTAYTSDDNANCIIRKLDNCLIQGCKITVIPNTVTSIGDKAFNGC